MIINRKIESELLSLAQTYPIVTVLGPRQSGKTTLVRHAFPKMPYVNLERPDIRQIARDDPRYFLSQYPDGAIFDEIQNEPELLSYLQVIVDEAKLNGQFILTGSHQLSLHEAITQSLAGRTALLTLYPFSIEELNGIVPCDDANQLMWRGFYPRVVESQLDPTKAYANYVATYLERDVRALINVKDLMSFQKFMKLCAGRVGQVLNMHSLANEVGVSSHTIKHWLSTLQASYLIVLLPPFFENVGKRVIKSPKLYFVDVGLACHLLNLHEAEHLVRDPLRGALFENMVVMECYKAMCNRGKQPEFYFYRDNAQHEIDLMAKYGNTFYLTEIKSSQTYRSEMTRELKYVGDLLSQEQVRSVIYAGETHQTIQGVQVLNYQDSILALP